jgi:hypothetical protein
MSSSSGLWAELIICTPNTEYSGIGRITDFTDSVSVFRFAYKAARCGEDAPAQLSNPLKGSSAGLPRHY